MLARAFIQSYRIVMPMSERHPHHLKSVHSYVYEAQMKGLVAFKLVFMDFYVFTISSREQSANVRGLVSCYPIPSLPGCWFRNVGYKIYFCALFYGGNGHCLPGYPCYLN